MTAGFSISGKWPGFSARKLTLGTPEAAGLSRTTAGFPGAVWLPGRKAGWNKHGQRWGGARLAASTSYPVSLGPEACRAPTAESVQQNAELLLATPCVGGRKQRKCPPCRLQALLGEPAWV